MENIGYLIELTSTERSTKWEADSNLLKSTTIKTQEPTQLWSQRDAGIHNLSLKWSACAYFGGNQVCWKPPFRILQLCLQDRESFSSGYAVNCAKNEPSFKGTQELRHMFEAEKHVYSCLQSRHLRENATFFFLLPSRNFKMFKCIAKKKKSDCNFIDMS